MTRLAVGLRVVKTATGVALVDLFGSLPPMRFENLPAHALTLWARGASEREILSVIGETWNGSLTPTELRAFITRLRRLGVAESSAARTRRERAFSSHVAERTLFPNWRTDVLSLRGLASQLVFEARASIAAKFGPISPHCQLDGVLSPHGDLDTTGTTAASGYAFLTQEAWPDVFIVLGTSHYQRSPAILTLDVQTPLGRVRTDRDVVHDLCKEFRPRLIPDEPTFLIEHSWRQDLPIVQTIAEEFGKPVRIVAILVGTMGDAACSRLGRILSEILLDQGKRGCLVASGDLSHYGADYGWAPKWLAGRRTVSDVVEAIEDFESPILHAIAARDTKTLRSVLPSSGFCARGQVHSLLSFVMGHGTLLDSCTVLNGKRLAPKRSRPWRRTDRLFRAASIAFGRGVQSPQLLDNAPNRLCREVLYGQHGSQVRLLHRCDNTAYELAASMRPALRELLGNSSVQQSTHGARARYDELVDFCVAKGLLHIVGHRRNGPTPDALLRASRAIAQAREGTRYYRATLDSDDLLDAPIVSSAYVRANTRAFTNLDEMATRNGRSLHRRWSSGSSGQRRLATVEDRDVVNERQLAAQPMMPRGDRWLVLNRPINLGLSASSDGLAWEMRDEGLAACPGRNPSKVSARVWDQCLDRALRYKPDILTGDPSFVNGFALRCRALGVRIPSLRGVILGHSYAWKLYVNTIRDTFGAPICHLYHSSELGEMGVTCEAGLFHLIEVCHLFELFCHGRWAQPGEVGALVVTDLVSRLRPLIRYANGDLVRLVTTSCSCGRPGRAVQFVGRLEHLFSKGQGYVAYDDIDAAIGSPRGLSWFHLRVAPRLALLTLASAGGREIVPAREISERLEDVIGRRISVQWRDAIELGHRGAKLSSLQVHENASRWHRHFFGNRRVA